MDTMINRPFATVSPLPSCATAASRSTKMKAVRFLALLFIALLGSATASFAQKSDSTPGPKGSWLYTVTIPDFGSFQGVETYASGGIYTEADQLSFSPSAVASAGHGAWKSINTNGRKFQLTYVNLTFDGYGSGNPTGTSKVRQTAKVDKTGNAYSGSGDFTYYDLDGNVVFGGTFTITATRIQVEAPTR